MKRKSLLIVLTLLFAVVSAHAFTLYNPPLKWASGNLPREVRVQEQGHSNVNDPDGGVTEIIDAVAAAWNQAVPGSVTSLVTYPSPPFSIGDGISAMGFNVSGTGCTGGCLGITITPIPSSTPQDETVNGTLFRLMTDSDIFFNTSTKFYSDNEQDGCRREYHIESVAVHEVGHLLGLGHTPVSGATMFATTGQCNNSGESLAQDDIDGINCIYNGTYGCGGCVPDTLIVDQTNCDQPTSGPNAGDFVVETFIVDNCGSAVEGADVTIDIPTSPSGPLSCSGVTGSTGRLGCALDNPPDGLYESLVASVSKAGFGNWNGSECNGTGNAPCGCSIDIGGGTGGNCGNGTCDVGESCDGRDGTTACSDCPGQTSGKPSNRFCYVNGVCEGPGCP